MTCYLKLLSYDNKILISPPLFGFFVIHIFECRSLMAIPVCNILRLQQVRKCPGKSFLKFGNFILSQGKLTVLTVFSTLFILHDEKKFVENVSVIMNEARSFF